MKNKNLVQFFLNLISFAIMYNCKLHKKLYYCLLSFDKIAVIFLIGLSRLFLNLDLRQYDL